MRKLKLDFALDTVPAEQRGYTKNEINQLCLLTGNIIELAGIMRDHALVDSEDAGRYAGAFEIIKLLLEPVDDFLEDAPFSFTTEPEPKEAPQ